VSSGALAQPRILLDPAPFAAPVNTMSINEIDLLNSTTPKWLFTIGMRTSDGTTLAAQLSMSLDIALATGEIFTNAVRIESKSPHFEVPGVRTITNLDFTGATMNKAVFDSEAKRRLEQIALPSGMVPAGTYTFNVRVRPATGGEESPTAQFSIIISNPSTVELLSPADGERFANPFQLFQWLYSGAQARISIFERLPGQGSLEETASGVPHLTETVSGNSFQYPSAGARPLQPGKTYVWFVEGLSGTAGGTQAVIKSALRSFTVAQQTTATAMVPGVLDELERALGPRYQTLFDQIRAGGLTETGILTLNGTGLSNADLQRILAYLRANSEVVTNASLE
jgi:hypothetical protein